MSGISGGSTATIVGADLSQGVVKMSLQAQHATAISAGATVYPASTLFVGTGGNVTVNTVGGETGVQFTNLVSGSILPVLVIAVTSATASGLILLR